MAPPSPFALESQMHNFAAYRRAWRINQIICALRLIAYGTVFVAAMFLGAVEILL